MRLRQSRWRAVLCSDSRESRRRAPAAPDRALCMLLSHTPPPFRAAHIAACNTIMSGAADAVVGLSAEDSAALHETVETLGLLRLGAPGDAAAAAAAAAAPASAASSAAGASASASAAAAAPASGSAGGGGGGGATSAAAASAETTALFGGRKPAAGKPAAGSTGSGAAPAHKFWSTQPVPKLEDKSPVVVSGPIDAPKTVADVRAEPYPLPEGFRWITLDVQDEAQRGELFRVLRDNYVEDDDNMFRFAYSERFLLWALTPPGYAADWHVGVRDCRGGKELAAGKLVAVITGVPAQMRIHGAALPLCEINFLCVHKALRAKRLAPLLIKEVTRRVNLRGVWQAAYTAGVVLPKPVASCQYWHRSLDPKKLIDVGFSRLAPRMTMPRTLRLYALPENCAIPGVRPATPADVPAITRLLAAYSAQFKLRPALSEEEVAHWLLPREGVIDSFVVDTATAAAAAAAVEGGSGGGAATPPPPQHAASQSTVTDFISFYHLPSTIIGHDKHKVLSAVYSYYIVPGASISGSGSGSGAAAAAAEGGGGGSPAAARRKAGAAGVGGGGGGGGSGHTLAALMADALVLARQRGVDVFNALDLMENDPALLRELKFGPGDGHLQYYLYNWQCPEIEAREVGLVLL